MVIKLQLTATLAALLLLMTNALAEEEIQLIAGAGPSTSVVTLFAEKLSALPGNSSYRFVVPAKSIKHRGGIEASSRYIFGRTGRPLNEQERAMNKDEIILARIPIAFATGQKSGINALSHADVEALFTGKIANWKEVGGNDAEVVVVGREPTEAIFSVLKKKYSAYNQARFSRVYKRDHQVVRYLESDGGGSAIAFGAHPNFEGLNVITVKDFSEGIEVGLVYDLVNREHELVKHARRFAQSSEWGVAVQQLGLLPPE